MNLKHSQLKMVLSSNTESLLEDTLESKTSKFTELQSSQNFNIACNTEQL